MKKYIIITTILVVVLVGLYYTLSPLWRNNELQEVSPLTNPDQSMQKQIEPTMERPSANMNDTTIGAADKTDTTGTIKKDVMTQQPELVAQGVFQAKAHDVKGKALLIKQGGAYTVRFEDFETINGPDVKIYLSSDLEAKDFVSLGDLKATKGNVNYTVPTGTDTTKYNKVLVWCKAFSVLFSYSELR